MMKVLIFFVCCVTVVYSWTSLEEVPIDPKNPDVCVTKDAKLTIKKGETITVPGQCVRASCSPGLVSYAGCGSISGPEGCKVGPEDYSKPYPECCPDIICP